MTPTGVSPHEAPLAALGIEARASARLARYLDALAAWSVRVNLTAARTPQERVDLLVASVLAAVSLPQPGRLIDVGSGNGSPGLVLALLREDLEVTLLEPRTRRWAFLREAARVAGPPRPVTVLRCRHDTYAGGPAATVCLRALALPLSELAPLVQAGGRVLVFGGRPVPDPPFTLAGSVPGVPGGAHVFARTAARPGPSGDVSRET